LFSLKQKPPKPIFAVFPEKTKKVKKNMRNIIEQTIRNNSEILDKLGQDMRIIAAYGNLSPALKKRMYSALYWAKYAMDINHNVLREVGWKA
jgi:hypothetical protein